MLVDGIIYKEAEFNGSDLSTRTYDCTTYMESMEAVRLLMKKVARSVFSIVSRKSRLN